jgi:hypothetical protein
VRWHVVAALGVSNSSGNRSKAACGITSSGQGRYVTPAGFLNRRREKDARRIMVVVQIQASTSNRLSLCGGETRKHPRMLPVGSGTLFCRAQTEVGEKDDSWRPSVSGSRWPSIIGCVAMWV